MPKRLNQINGIPHPVKLEFRNIQDLIRDRFYKIAEQTACGINQRDPKSAVKGWMHDGGDRCSGPLSSLERSLVAMAVRTLSCH